MRKMSGEDAEGTGISMIDILGRGTGTDWTSGGQEQWCILIHNATYDEHTGFCRYDNDSGWRDLNNVDELPTTEGSTRANEGGYLENYCERFGISNHPIYLNENQIRNHESLTGDRWYDAGVGEEGVLFPVCDEQTMNYQGAAKFIVSSVIGDTYTNGLERGLFQGMDAISNVFSSNKNINNIYY